MIARILRKDLQLLWPMVVFVTLIQACLEWVYYAYGFFGANPAAHELLQPLTIAWYAGIVALAAMVVQQDAVPALDQDWLVRPVRRRDLLLAKLAFVALTICLPMFVFNLVRGLANGFALGAVLQELALKELLVLAWLIVPVLALSALTNGLIELLVLGAALIAAYTLGLLASALIMGADRCPTCETGLTWLQHLLQHTATLLGACVVLALQYFRRRTQLSRVLALLGAVALAVAQLPWGSAFALQRWLSAAPGAAAAVSLAVAPERTPGAAEVAQRRAAPLGVREATRALLAGNFGGAVEYLQSRGASRDGRARIELPVRVGGLGANELLLVDRVRFTLADTAGRKLYSANVRGFGQPASSAAAGAPRVQVIQLPGSLYRALAQRDVALRLDYSLTLMGIATERRLPARDAEFRAPDLGRCATQVDPQSVASLSCKTVGVSPFCLSETLFAADGRHDPETLYCDPDYRPDVPSLTSAFHQYYVETPVQDPFGAVRYPVERSDLEGAYLQIKIFAVREHFKRSLIIPSTRLADWQAGTP